MAVREGRKLGITGKRFKHVVNIGIGGLIWVPCW